jgi:hypothetical protein
VYYQCHNDQLFVVRVVSHVVCVCVACQASFSRAPLLRNFPEMLASYRTGSSTQLLDTSDFNSSKTCRGSFNNSSSSSSSGSGTETVEWHGSGEVDADNQFLAVPIKPYQRLRKTPSPSPMASRLYASQSQASMMLPSKRKAKKRQRRVLNRNSL